MQPEEVLDLALRCGAMLEGHFELSSGKHSDRYLQCALLLQEPRRAERLASGLAAKLEPEVDVVVGPALGAVVWAQEVGRALSRRAIFTERSNGEMALRRGFALEKGERVLVVEDVLTTGGSAREVLDVIERAGASTVAVGSIFNRSGGNPFEARGLPLVSLAEVNSNVWSPEECPLCRAGAAPAVKPGSRPGERASASRN